MKKNICIILFIALISFLISCNNTYTIKFIYDGDVILNKEVKKGSKIDFFEYEKDDYFAYDWLYENKSWNFEEDIVTCDIILEADVVFKGGIQNRVKYIDIDDSFTIKRFKEYKKEYDGEIKWESSDTSVISITNSIPGFSYESGKVFARDYGTAEIRLYYNDELKDKLTVTVISFEDTFKSVFGDKFKPERAIMEDYLLPGKVDLKYSWSIEENDCLSIERINNDFYVIINKDAKFSQISPWTEFYDLTLSYEYNGEILDKVFIIQARYEPIKIVSIEEHENNPDDSPRAIKGTVYKVENPDMPVYWIVDENGSIFKIRPIERKDIILSYEVGDILLYEINVKTTNDKIKARIVYCGHDVDFDPTNVLE